MQAGTQSRHIEITNLYLIIYTTQQESCQCSVILYLHDKQYFQSWAFGVAGLQLKTKDCFRTKSDYKNNPLFSFLGIFYFVAHFGFLALRLSSFLENTDPVCRQAMPRAHVIFRRSLYGYIVNVHPVHTLCSRVYSLHCTVCVVSVSIIQSQHFDASDMRGEGLSMIFFMP